MITSKQKVLAREIKLRSSDGRSSPIPVLSCSLQSHPLKQAPVNFTQLLVGREREEEREREAGTEDLNGCLKSL